jgi:tripartite-type tricarboxylate transporter receptor subunit TctC
MTVQRANFDCLAIAATAVMIVMAGMTPAAAQTAESFYKGKTVTVAIGSGVGGSHDQWGRLAARHMGKHIPGQPNLVPKNYPGAGGMALANIFWAQGPKDGSTFGIINRGVLFEPLFNAKNAKGFFDPRKFSWVGSPDSVISVAVAWHTSPVRKWQDLYDKELIVGAVGAATGTTKEAYVMNNLLGFKYKVIMGYPGGSDVDLAMERGEINGRANLAYGGLKNRNIEQVKDGRLIILYQMGLERHPEMPDVPLVLDFARNDEERRLLELNFLPSEVGYPFIAPPDVPPERVAALRDAFKKMTEDPELRADAAKQRLDVNYISGERLEALMAKAYSASPEMVARILDLSQPRIQEDMARAMVVKTSLTGSDKRGITFTDRGKKTEARVSDEDTQITKAGQKIDAATLAQGMLCEITYYGDKGTAAKITCD